MELFELIQTLNRAHGPSGDEGEIREVIRALAEPYADEITADTMGSLIVHRRGKGPKLLLAAHMDSIGFVVTPKRRPTPPSASKAACGGSLPRRRRPTSAS